MAHDPERDRELRLLEEEADRLDEDFEHLADQWKWVQQRIQHLKRKQRPHLRVLRGGALGAVSTAAGAAWHKAATHPGTASGMLAALAIAIATPFVMDGPRPDTPSVAAPPPPPMKPPTTGAPPPTRSPQESPPGTTAPGGEPERGSEPTTSRQRETVPLAEAGQAATVAPVSPQPPAQPEPEPEPAEPDERNENEPPPDPSEPPESEPPPEPTQPDCTGLHVDASPVAEACVLGESVLEAEVLG